MLTITAQGAERSRRRPEKPGLCRAKGRRAQSEAIPVNILLGLTLDIGISFDLWALSFGFLNILLFVFSLFRVFVIVCFLVGRNEFEFQPM